MNSAGNIENIGNQLLSYYYSTYAYVFKSLPALPFEIEGQSSCTAFSRFCDKCCAMKTSLFRMALSPSRQPYSEGYQEYEKSVKWFILNEGHECFGSRLPWNNHSRTRAAYHRCQARSFDVNQTLCEILVICIFTELFQKESTQSAMNCFSTLATIFQNISATHYEEREASVLSYLRGESSLNSDSEKHLHMLEQAREILEDYYGYDITELTDMWPDDVCGRIEGFT